jgi:tol-pal system protein YbgF
MLTIARPRSRFCLRVVPVLFLALAGASAHAELFPDNEARKAIVELREKIASDEHDTSARLDKLAQQLDQQMQQSASAQLDLNQQIESLRREVATLRGTVEVLQKDVADLQKRQRDTYSDIDNRLKKQEPQKVTIEGREVLVDPEQIRTYNAAFEQFRASQFAQSANGFALFQTLYPSSPYVPLARFWLGNAQFATRDFKNAIATLQGFIKAYPDHSKVPDALVSIGNCQIELNDKKAARITLRSVIDKYAGTQAAQNAKERLATIK